MSNIVLLYTGNVCSSAMIEYANLCDDVLVPVREGLDLYQFEKVFTDESQLCVNFSHVLSDIYDRKDYTFLQQNSLVHWRQGEPIPTAEQKPHLLFKWRAFSTNLPGSDVIGEVFRKNATAPIVLLRKSLSQQALKVFLSEKVYGGRHQQGKTQSMSEEAYVAYMKEQDAISITVTNADLTEIRNIATSFLNKTLKLIKSAKYYFPHHETPALLFAEDIFNPLIDVDRFNHALGAMCGAIAPLTLQQAPKLRKSGLNICHCANAEEVFHDPKIAALERQYQAAAAGLSNIFRNI